MNENYFTATGPDKVDFEMALPEEEFAPGPIRISVKFWVSDRAVIVPLEVLVYPE